LPLVCHFRAATIVVSSATIPASVEFSETRPSEPVRNQPAHRADSERNDADRERSIYVEPSDRLSAKSQPRGPTAIVASAKTTANKTGFFI
jgi:hypothetical protein